MRGGSEEEEGAGESEGGEMGGSSEAEEVSGQWPSLITLL